MFTETLIAVFVIGFLAGVVFMQLTAVRSWERHTRRITEQRRRETRQAIYRQQAREHHGTPYIVRMRADNTQFDRAVAADNDRWSRKALPDNVTRIGVSR
jgi:uncharacterized membrane protein YccC